jgi:hypothetical protein
VNGNRVGGRTLTTATGPGAESKTERVISLNGRSVPLESIEEKVIEEGPRGRVVERTIQRFDQNGRPTPPEKVRIEERPGSGGRLTTTKTVYEADLNGNFRVRERERTQATISDTKTNSTIVVERPTVNGSMNTVERRVISETTSETNSSRDETIYRPDQSASFVPASREVTQTNWDAQGRRITTARYNTVNDSAQMILAGQTVTDVETRADGSQTTVIREYGTAVPGRSIAAGNRTPQLREQQIIERAVQRDGSVVETTGVQRVSVSDPSKLEAYQPVSETVCRGNCIEKSSAAAATADKQSGNN